MRVTATVSFLIDTEDEQTATDVATWALQDVPGLDVIKSVSVER
jgi:hypothetical protein